MLFLLTAVLSAPGACPALILSLCSPYAMVIVPVPELVVQAIIFLLTFSSLRASPSTVRTFPWVQVAQHMRELCTEFHTEKVLETPRQGGKVGRGDCGLGWELAWGRVSHARLTLPYGVA